MKSATLAITIGLGTLSLPCLSLAQTVDEIFKLAQERFTQNEQDQASWSAEKREAADKATENLKADRCVSGESASICKILVLCSTAPEIAGEKLPDDRELLAANQAMDDVEDDLSKLPAAMRRVKLASARFQKGAREARNRCETRIRIAYRSEAGAAGGAESSPDEAAETSARDPVYDGPVAIRPMVTAPRLMGRVPPARTKAQTLEVEEQGGSWRTPDEGRAHLAGSRIASPYTVLLQPELSSRCLRRP